MQTLAQVDGVLENGSFFEAVSARLRLAPFIQSLAVTFNGLAVPAFFCAGGATPDFSRAGALQHMVDTFVLAGAGGWSSLRIHIVAANYREYRFGSPSQTIKVATRS